MAGEEISDKILDEVIEALNGDKPPTKKWACEKLGIKYNTKRLQKLIEDRIAHKEAVSRMKKKLRGTAVSKEEAAGMIAAYLTGESLSAISKQTFRSLGFVKKVLEDNNVPIRAKKTNFFDPELLPCDIVRKELKPESIVFSARYNEVAKVRCLAKVDENHGPIYSLRLLNSNKMSYQPWYELGDLSELFEKYNLGYMVL